MNEAEKKEKSRLDIQEIKTTLIGIPNTDDGGLVQVIGEIKKHIIRQNGRIRKLELTVVFLLGAGGLSLADALLFNKVFGG